MQKEVVKRAALVTLGCKVNWYDSEAIAGALKAAGFVVVEPDEPADVYVVNTCAVTAEADRKSRQAVRRLLRMHPGTAVIAAGCSAQKDPQGYAGIGGVAAVCGTERASVAGLAVRAAVGERGLAGLSAPLHAFEDMQASEQQGHARAVLKIEDGCDARCAYCVIPDVRGEPRSRPIASIQSEARALAERGFKEIVLVGINLGRYGAGLPGKLTLADAAEAACVPGVSRIRLGSLEPEAVTPALLDRLSALPAVCPHFHMSLQSGSAATLSRMGRRYTPMQFVDKLEMIRRVWPGVGITTDVIVGFPGETDDEFAESCAFVASAGFLKAHVFPYSARPGTPAAAMPGQIPKAVKAARAAAMQAAAAPGAQAFLNGLIGTAVEVLFEEPFKGRPGWMRGYAGCYADVATPAGNDARGKIAVVDITGIEGETAFGNVNRL